MENGSTQPQGSLEGTVPSTADEAEQAVLGAVLLSGSVALPAAMEEGVREDDFSREPYRLMFSAMAAMRRDDEPIDHLTLCDRLKRDGILDDVGGRVAVEVLGFSVPHVGNLRQYARIVVRSAMWRARRRLMHEACEAVLDEDEMEFRRVLGRLRESELHYRPLTERADTLTP